MLRVNVGLSRKLSKDYNSTGYSVNIDGEVTAPTADPEAVMEQVKELFDLAEEALDLQIDRAQSDVNLARRDNPPPPAKVNGNGNRNPPQSNGNGQSRFNPRNGQPDRRSAPPRDEPATNKQINYLLNIGKRQRLSTAQLEKKVSELVGRKVGVYDLSKQAAAQVIDKLTNPTTANTDSVHY